MSTPEAQPPTNCHRCGERLPYGAAFCAACGTRVDSGQTVVREVPDGVTRASRAVGRFAHSLRDRVRATAETVSVRVEAQQRITAIRAESHRLGEERRRLLYRLGEAVYGGDDAGSSEAREAVARIDRELALKAKEMHAIATEAEEKASFAKLQAQPTSVLPGPEPPTVPTPPDPNPDPEPPPAPNPEPPSPGPDPTPLPEPRPPGPDRPGVVD